MATTQDDSNLSVLIAGAGLSGPSLAACLARHRLPFTIFEVARPHAAQPYAITLQRWAYEPLIHALVMHNPDAAIQAFRRDVAVDARVGGTGRVDAGIVDAATGESIVPGVAIGDESHVHANGEMLRQWLIRQAGEGNVRFDARVAGLRTDDRGVTVVLGSGEEVRGRCLVAADGVDSTVRRVLLPDATPKPLPVVFYNWQRTVTRAEYDDGLASYFDNTTVLHGTSRGVNICPSIIDINDTHVKTSWTLSRRYKPTEPQSSQRSQTAIYDEIQKELRAVGTLAPPYNDLLERPVTDKDEFFRWPICSLRMKKWDLDRLCDRGVILIGDAAHAMPVSAGECGDHALLDGVELAAILASAGRDVAIEGVGRRFYDGAVERWHQGVEIS